MEASQVYISIAIVALLIIAIIVFFVKKNRKEKLTPLVGFSFAFILAGSIFGEDRLMGYSLMGIGVLLALIDIFKKAKKKKQAKRKIHY